MKRFFKKGFTLVELVVVIAIIAILSGVGVAVYIGVTNKAKASADSQVITQLNLKLKADRASAEGANENCYEAYLDAREIGFDLNLLKPQTNDAQYVWDEENDLFAVVKGDEIIAQDKNTNLTNNVTKRWIFVNSINSNETRSQYLTSDSYKDNVNVISGFDAGSNELISSVTYSRNTTSGQSVLLRTNSNKTVVTINSKLDSVTHFGKAKEVLVESVAPHSYIEKGSVLGNINLKNGRVVLESGCSANAVYVDATVADINAGNVAVSANNSKEPEIPIILREDVKAAADAKGGDNDIPNPQQDYVILLGDKVVDEQGHKTEVDAVVQLAKAGKNFATIQEGLDALTAGDTLILLKDVNNVLKLSINKTIDGEYSFDLNKHTITFASETVSADLCAFVIEGKGSYTIGNGTLKSTDYRYGDIMDIWSDTELNNLTVEFTDEQVDGFARWGAVYNAADNLVMNSCTLNAIKGPGFQNGEKGAKTIINDCTITSGNHSALYCGGGSITEVYNSKVSGARAVHACTSGAAFYVYSGEFTGTEAAIQLDNTTESVDYLGIPNYECQSYIQVNGGTFHGALKNNARSNGKCIFIINGGTFDVDVSSYISK